MPTEPGVTRTEEIVETKTVTNETTTPVSETVEVEQKTDTVTNEDGSTTITTETTTTTTTESETTTKQETTTTTTETYEVKSEGSYVTDSEEVAAYIAAQEEEKQKEIKADVEEKGGSYEYNVEITDTPSTEHKVEEGYDTGDEADKRAEELRSADEADPDMEIKNIEITETASKEERETKLNQLAEKAEELGGEVNGENTKVDDESSTIEATFKDKQQAEEFINEALRTYGEEKIVSYNIEETEIIRSEDIDEGKGYHAELEVDEKGNYVLTIYITGGVKDIDICLQDGGDLNFEVEPGDDISYTIRIINESQDEYEITDYERELWGPFKYILDRYYDESYGEKVDLKEYEGSGITFYKPSSFESAKKQYNNREVAYSTIMAFLEYYNLTPADFNNMTISERNALINEFNTNGEQHVLDYYNKVLGTAGTENEYDDFYEAWKKNLLENCWHQEYNGENADTYFEKLIGTKVNDMTLNAFGSVDFWNTDNLYQNTVWLFQERLALTLVKNYIANVEVDDVDYKVEYDEINHTYEVEVAGLGTYTVKEEETETEETKLTVVDVKTETVVEKETVPPAPDQPVVPVIPNIPFFPAEVGNNPQNGLLEIDDFMTPLAGSLIMNEGDCIN